MHLRSATVLGRSDDWIITSLYPPFGEDFRLTQSIWSKYIDLPLANCSHWWYYPSMSSININMLHNEHLDRPFPGSYYTLLVNFAPPTTTLATMNSEAPATMTTPQKICSLV